MFSKLLTYLAISFFIALSTLHAIDNKEAVKKGNTIANVKQNFTKDGGSSQGLMLLEKAIHQSTNESIVAKNEILSLREELQKVISSESFDKKQYMVIKSKINDVMMNSVNNKDKIMISLLKDLSFHDRKIVANILKNMLLVNSQ